MESKVKKPTKNPRYIETNGLLKLINQSID